jgi:plastocyanin
MQTGVGTAIFLALAAGLLSAAGLSGADASALFRLVDAKGAPVADAVVSLYALDGVPAASPPATAAVEVVQKNLEFIPFVTAVQVGTTVAFPNRDSVQHHVYSLSKAKRFEIPLYGKSTQASIVFDQSGVVTLGCNIHDWMIGYVVVVATPHFAKSAADGTAVVADVPAGSYRAEVWHPRLTELVKQEIEVRADAALPEATMVLTLKSDRRIRRAPDAGGGG